MNSRSCEHACVEAEYVVLHNAHRASELSLRQSIQSNYSKGVSARYVLDISARGNAFESAAACVMVTGLHDMHHLHVASRCPLELKAFHSATQMCLVQSILDAHSQRSHAVHGRSTLLQPQHTCVQPAPADPRSRSTRAHTAACTPESAPHPASLPAILSHRCTAPTHPHLPWTPMTADHHKLHLQQQPALHSHR